MSEKLRKLFHEFIIGNVRQEEIIKQAKQEKAKEIFDDLERVLEYSQNLAISYSAIHNLKKNHLGEKVLKNGL